MSAHELTRRVVWTIGILGSLALPHQGIAGKPAPPPPPPPVKYEVTIVGQDFSVNAINNAGTVVGEANGRAYVRLEDGRFDDLTDLARFSEPGQEWTVLDRARDINEVGQIVGRGFRMQGGDPVARLYRFSPPSEASPQVLEYLYTEAGPSSLTVRKINDFGDVLIHRHEDGGSSYPETANATDSAWIYTGPPGQGSPSKILDSAAPKSLNNLGQVTGQIDTGAASAAFLYSGPDPDDLVTFGTITGSPTTAYNVSDGFAINDFGDIGGWARVGGSNSSNQAVLRLSGASAWNDMGISYTGNGWVSAINNSGVPVGGSGGVNALGFVYLNGKAYSLKDLMINPPGNIYWVDPSDINDSGVICGSLSVLTGKVKGSNQYAYYGVILTPVPQ